MFNKVGIIIILMVSLATVGAFCVPTDDSTKVSIGLSLDFGETLYWNSKDYGGKLGEYNSQYVLSSRGISTIYRIKNNDAVILNIVYSTENYLRIYFDDGPQTNSKAISFPLMDYQIHIYEPSIAYRYYFNRSVKHNAKAYIEGGLEVGFMTSEFVNKNLGQNDSISMPTDTIRSWKANTTRKIAFNRMNFYFGLGFLNPIGKHFYFKTGIAFHTIPFILERYTTEKFYNANMLFDFGILYRFY